MVSQDGLFNNTMPHVILWLFQTSETITNQHWFMQPDDHKSLNTDIRPHYTIHYIPSVRHIAQGALFNQMIINCTHAQGHKTPLIVFHIPGGFMQPSHHQSLNQIKHHTDFIDCQMSHQTFVFQITIIFTQ